MQLLRIYLISFLAVIVCLLLVYSQWSPTLSNLFQTCWLGETPLSSMKWLQQFRGGNYWLSTGGTQQQKYCLITSWAVSHMVLYAIIGYLFPEMFWQTLIIGIAYEFFEWATLNCHDALDILWNSFGFLIGAGLSKLN